MMSPEQVADTYQNQLDNILDIPLKPNDDKDYIQSLAEQVRGYILKIRTSNVRRDGLSSEDIGRFLGYTTASHCMTLRSVRTSQITVQLSMLLGYVYDKEKYINGHDNYVKNQD